MTFPAALRFTLAVFGAAVASPALAQEAIHPETVQKVKAALERYHGKPLTDQPGSSWLTPAQGVTCANPQYSAMAIRNGFEGTAIMEFKVNAEAKPVNARLVQSTGSAILDQAVLQAFTLCAFPGKTTEDLYRQPYRFVLQEAG